MCMPMYKWMYALLFPRYSVLIGGGPGPGDPRAPGSAHVHPDILEAFAEEMGASGLGDPDFGAPVPSLALVALREVRGRLRDQT